MGAEGGSGGEGLVVEQFVAHVARRLATNDATWKAATNFLEALLSVANRIKKTASQPAPRHQPFHTLKRKL